MVQPTISPDAAANAECTASATQEAVGSLPLAGYVPPEHATATGSWQQYRYSATPKGAWRFQGYVVVIEETLRYGPRASGEEVITNRNTVETYADTTPPDSPGSAYPSPNNAHCEFTYREELHDSEDGHILAYVDITHRIVSITARFGRDLPRGPILCNRSGVLVCNRSGDLLWH